MSGGWDAYVTNLVQTKAISKAAIVGHNGSIWAKSQDLNISATEITNIMKNWSPANLAQGGFHLGGVKYLLVRMDDTQIIGKLSGSADGVVIGKTKQALVLGFHTKDQSAGNANKEVMKIADYLSNQGY